MIHHDPKPRDYNQLAALVSGMEQSVNKNVTKIFLHDPMNFHIEDYTPLDDCELVAHDFSFATDRRPAGSPKITAQFSQNTNDNYPAIHAVTARWADGHEYTLADGKIYGYLKLFSHNNQYLAEPQSVDIDNVGKIVEDLGIPYDTIGESSPQATQSLIDTFSKDTRKLTINREHECPPLHEDAGLIFRQHTHFIPHDDLSNNVSIVNEFTATFKHYTDSDLNSTFNELVGLPTAHPEYANSLVFRQDEEGVWKYRGTYNGKVTPGELLGEYIEHTDSLSLPSPQLSRWLIDSIDFTTGQL